MYVIGTYISQTLYYNHIKYNDYYDDQRFTRDNKYEYFKSSKYKFVFLK